MIPLRKIQEKATMTSTMKSKTLVVIAGPTAVGKTALSLDIAIELGAEIVSADARQFYREISTGTAKPTNEELALRPHHFIGHLSIHDYYSASMYENNALNTINALFEKDDFVVMCGGSGLYIDAICHGFDSVPGYDPQVRTRVQGYYRETGLEGIRRWLRRVDPVYYGQADIANPKRIMRALEVFLSAGVPYSTFLKKSKVKRDFRIRKIVLELPRNELFAAINTRTGKMIEEGLVEEAWGLYNYRHLNALNTVGYKEIFAWISNSWSLNTAIEKIRVNTRRYAKRQLTWFRRYDDAAFLNPADRKAIMDYIKGS